jgi:hypothetical protein
VLKAGAGDIHIISAIATVTSVTPQRLSTALAGGLMTSLLIVHFVSSVGSPTVRTMRRAARCVFDG